MKSKKIILLFILLLSGLMAVSGCSTDSNDDPSITGSWIGSTTIEGGTFTLDIQLQDNSGSINGNGTMVFVEPIAINASGTHNYPNLSMTIRSNVTEDLNFNGTLSGDGNAITGSLRGSGFDNFSMTIRRQ